MSESIQDFYANKTILITGATGFLGSYLVEKLLRSCTDIKKIYLLIRPKSHKTGQDRLDELLDNPVYTNIRESNPTVLKKLTLLVGDLELPELGLNDQDLERIKRDVNCIFHIGATVRFVEELRRAILINVYGTSALLRIAKESDKLECLVHVSTAYSQDADNVIEEIFYSSVENSDTLIQMAKTIDNKKLNAMTPIILGKWLNTYVFTKHVAEDVIRVNAENLPIVIIRPSIILPPYKEPKLHWTNAVESITLLLVAFNLGILHSVYSNLKNKVDIVPADFVVNCIIAAGWKMGSRKIKESSPQIFNYVNYEQNPITWAYHEKLLAECDAVMPSNKKIFHRVVFHSTNRILLRTIDLLFMPWLYLINLKNFFNGKPSRPLKLYEIVKKYTKVVEPFTSGEWYFQDKNTQSLWSSLRQEDKEIFQFDIQSIDWKMYYCRLTAGLRSHVLKDTSPIKEARRRACALRVLYYIFTLIYVSIISIVLYTLVRIAV